MIVFSDVRVRDLLNGVDKVTYEIVSRNEIVIRTCSEEKKTGDLKASDRVQ